MYTYKYYMYVNVYVIRIRIRILERAALRCFVDLLLFRKDVKYLAKTYVLSGTQRNHSYKYLAGLSECVCFSSYRCAFYKNHNIESRFIRNGVAFV